MFSEQQAGKNVGIGENGTPTDVRERSLVQNPRPASPQLLPLTQHPSFILLFSCLLAPDFNIGSNGFPLLPFIIFLLLRK